MNRQERRAAKKRTKKLNSKNFVNASAADQAAYVQSRLSAALADHKSGLLDSAIVTYREVLTLRPDIAAAHNALGAALNEQGQGEQALECFNTALEIDPNFTDARQNRDNLASILAGGSTPIINTTDSASDVTTLFNQANRLKASGELAEAARTYTEVIKQNPTHARAYANLGDTFLELRSYESAVVMLQAAVLYDPENAASFNGLGTALAYRGQIEEALNAFEKSLELNPTNISTLTNLGNVYKDLGDIKKAIETYRRALEISPKVDIHSNILLAMHYVPSYTQEDIYKEHRRWNELYAEALLPTNPAYKNKVDPERPIKVGLVSGSFSRHPVGYMTITALEALSRDNIHLTFYSNSGHSDDLTERYKLRADEWLVITGLDDETLAKKVKEDEIDILIDLAGHSGGFRLLTFARKPAPVQAKWVGGQINTTGMDAMDYFISDGVETPEGVDEWYTESIVRLPDGYVCYEPPFYAPPVVTLPAKENGYVTFGCFNNLTKVTPDVIGAWSQILASVPDSKIVLKSKALNDDTVRQRYLSLFLENGISEECVDLRQSSPHDQLLKEYGDIDISLDPFPYSGGLTTVESLYMGVPVLSYPGETFAGRHAASHISNVELQDWVTESLEDYVTQAIDRANDLESLEELRQGLREKVKASPLCDADRFAKNFESALRDMWRDWCAKQRD